MANIFGEPTDLPDVLTLIETALVDASVVRSEYVYWSFESEEMIGSMPPADRFVWLRPEGFDINPGMTDGGGRSSMWCEGSLSIALWSRLGTDLDARDRNWLKDATLGAWVKWKAIMQALQLFEAENDAAKRLVIEPMRLIRFEFGKRAPRQGWGRVHGAWDLKFVQKLT